MDTSLAMGARSRTLRVLGLCLFVLMTAPAAVAAPPAGPPAPPGATADAPGLAGTASVTSGGGVAPGAPEWVRQHVAEVQARRLGAASEQERSLQSARRVLGGCQTAWVKYSWDTPFGNAWGYIQQISWCWNNGVLTSFYRDRWADCCSWFWHFRGNIGTNCIYEHCDGRGSGQWSAQAWTQGKFEYCYAWCSAEKDPLVAMTVYANGSYSSYTQG